MSDSTTIVMWPEIQDYMTKEGFRENAVLLNSPKQIDEYGSSAYRINNDWLKEVDEGKHRELTEEEIEALSDDEDSLMIDWGEGDDYED